MFKMSINDVVEYYQDGSYTAFKAALVILKIVGAGDFKDSIPELPKQIKEEISDLVNIYNQEKDVLIVNSGGSEYYTAEVKKWIDLKG